MVQDLQLATKASTEKERTEISYAFFFLDHREFGIAVEHVRETISNRYGLIRMPCTTEIVDGLINLRGAVIPIINLRTRLHITPPLDDQEHRIAITRFNGHLFGLIFDDISEVSRISQNDLRRIETTETDLDRCSSSVLSLDNGNRIVQLLDLELLFKQYHLPRIDNADEDSHQNFRQKKQNITFLLDDQEYALDVDEIREIINVPEIRRKVLVDPAIKGVISLRGELVSVVDLRSCLGLSPGEIREASRIIILQGDLACGILVDAICEVVHFEEHQLLPIPTFEKEDCFSGIIALETPRNIIQIAPARLFSDALMTQINGNLRMHVEEQEAKAAAAENAKELSIAHQVLISFRLEHVYAFDILLFQEIIEYTDGIIPLPGRQDFHQGVLNLRGKAVPIINLRRYYGMPDAAENHSGKIIILNLGKDTIGIMVDSILEIIKPDQADVMQVPQLASLTANDVRKEHIKDAFQLRLSSGEERMFLIYDIEQLIHEIGHQNLAPPDDTLDAIST